MSVSVLELQDYTTTSSKLEIGLKMDDWLRIALVMKTRFLSRNRESNGSASSPHSSRPKTEGRKLCFRFTCPPMPFEPTKGIEPLTYGLRYRCSTVELSWHGLGGRAKAPLYPPAIASRSLAASLCLAGGLAGVAGGPLSYFGNIFPQIISIVSA